MVKQLTGDSNTSVGTTTTCCDDDTSIEDGSQVVRKATSCSIDSEGESDSDPRLKEPDNEVIIARADYGISIAGQQPKAHIVVTCPLTKQPLKDPVVNPVDGVSYERSAIANVKDKHLYYPNRALKEYIEATADTTTHHVKNVLDSFLCPITQDLMRDPVIDSEGNTYERSAVVGWIQKHGVSPITRKPLTINQLYNNSTLFWVLVQEIQLCHHLDDDCHQDQNDTVQEWQTALACSDNYDKTKGILQVAERLRQLQPSFPNAFDDTENNIHFLVTTAPNTDVSSSTNLQLDDLVRQETQQESQHVISMLSQPARIIPERQQPNKFLAYMLSFFLFVVFIMTPSFFISLVAGDFWITLYSLMAFGIFVLGMFLFYLFVNLLSYCLCPHNVQS